MNKTCILPLLGLALLVGGVAKEAHAQYDGSLVPFWYCGDDSFVSLPYASGYRSVYSDNDTSWWALPAFLTWGKTSYREARTSLDGSVLLGFGGWEIDDYQEGVISHKGEYRRQYWAWPLFGHTTTVHTGKTVSTWFLSGLVGWKSADYAPKEAQLWTLYDWEREDHLWTPFGVLANSEFWATMLVGAFRDRKNREAGWVFPIWHHGKDKNYDKTLAKLDSSTLPKSIKVVENTVTNMQNEVEHEVSARGPSGSDTTTWLLLLDNDRYFSVNGRNPYGSTTNDCRVVSRRKIGNRLAINYESRRTIRYDLKTKQKVSDVETQELSLLCNLFRCEHNSKKGTSVSLLFIPVWRP